MTSVRTSAWMSDRGPLLDDGSFCPQACNTIHSRAPPSLARSRPRRLRFGGASCGLRSVSAQTQLDRSARAHLSVYPVTDKIISLYQGRSVSFRESDLHLPCRFLDWYEEQELWTPYAYGGPPYQGSQARALRTFTALCKLSLIMVRFASSRPVAQLLLISFSFSLVRRAVSSPTFTPIEHRNSPKLFSTTFLARSTSGRRRYRRKSDSTRVTRIKLLHLRTSCRCSELGQSVAAT